ncbi:MAG TPA: trehalose-phosphatase [Candidatus Goldiibacteriota bacterium]|nr:trehalose-phosphatase [Candidatus Goldiibacteriota bacterium]
MRCGRMLFCFDFDGTLSDIVKNPDKAQPVKNGEKSVERLAALKGCIVCVISGRRIYDLKKRFKVKNIIYCGNHGAEIQGRGISYRFRLDEAYKKSVKCASFLVWGALKKIPGFIKENKGYVTAFHYRNVSAPDRLKVERWFRNFADAGNSMIRIRKGNKVFEILPAIFTGKAQAIRLIAEKEQIPEQGVFFAGDDTTDIEAFKELGKKTVKVFIGRKTVTAADMLLKSPQELVLLLEIMMDLMKEG